MIKLSNGHRFEYVVASGALAFSGRGWWWERPFIWLGIIKPELFTIVIKTLTLKPTKGNLNWWKPWTWLPFSPWSCVRLIPGGAVNKVGLTNKGFNWWLETVAPTIDFTKQAIIVSLHGTREELCQMATTLDRSFLGIVGLELNVSCPNTGEAMSEAEAIIRTVKAVHAMVKQPLVLKLSAAQDCLSIVKALESYIEAVSLNSVPWEMVFPIYRSRLWRLQKRVGGGGGGVSGQAAQLHNWQVAANLAKHTTVPVICPSIWAYRDIAKARELGAKAVSFGAVFLRYPWRPTWFVIKEEYKQEGESD